MCGTGFLAPFGALLGLLEAIGRAVDVDDLGVVDEAIDERDDTGGVGKDLAPFGEGAVGGDEGGFVLVAPGDDLEEQIGMAVRVGEVTDLVDDQPWGPGIERRRRRRALSPSWAASSLSLWAAVVKSTV